MITNSDRITEMNDLTLLHNMTNEQFLTYLQQKSYRSTSA